MVGPLVTVRVYPSIPQGAVTGKIGLGCPVCHQGERTGRRIRDEGREPVELSPRLLEQTIHVGPREPALFRPVPTTNAAMPVLSRLTRCEPLTRAMKTTSTDGLCHSETSQLSR